MANCNKHRENCGCEQPCPPKPCPPKPDPCHDLNCGGAFPKDFKLINDICELKRKLSEVFVRFDSDPSFYTKDDYKILLRTLSLSLIHLYKESLTKLVCEDRTILEKEGCSNILYLVPKLEDDPSLADDNKYDEYLYIGEAFELVGGSGGQDFPEAPEDGNLYGRKDGDWAIIEEVAPYVFPGIISKKEDLLTITENADTHKWEIDLTDTIANLPTELAAEINNRTLADNALGFEIETVATNLETEVTDRTTITSALDTRVTALENKVCDDAVFAEGFTTNITVGWLPSGYEVKKGDSISALLKSILLGTPVYDVTAVNPSRLFTLVDKNGAAIQSGSSSSPKTYAEGDTVTLTYTQFVDGYYKAINSWGANQPANCQDTGMYLRITNTSGTILDQATVTLDSPTATLTVPSSGDFRIIAGWTYGTSTTIPKKSDGSDSSVRISSTGYTNNLYYGRIPAAVQTVTLYYGGLDTEEVPYEDWDAAYIKANLTKQEGQFDASGLYTFTAVTPGDHDDAVLIPANLENKTTIKHAQFGYDMEDKWDDKRNITIDGVDYRCKSTSNGAASDLSLLITIQL